MQKELEADGYSYAGRYYEPFVGENGEFRLGRSESKLLVAAHNMLKFCDQEPRVLCCRNFSKALAAYPHHNRDQQRHIILSEEPFGNQWRDTRDWEAIREAIGDDWDVTVVVGYRRFYAWLPSAHFQRERIDRNRAQKSPWPAHGGRKLVPFFPTWMQEWRQHFQYTADILDALNGTFPVRIINLHNEEHHSPLRVLLCEILDGQTKTACRESMAREERDQTVMNTQNTVPSLYYDAMATAAADKGLVNLTAWTRPDVRQAIQDRQEVELGLRPEDLELDCPNKKKLNGLLNASLALEARYMPEFAQRPHQLEEHRLGFGQYVEQKVFCWVDTEAMLSKPDWNEFFKQFST